jgi:uncharacterized protein
MRKMTFLALAMPMLLAACSGDHDKPDPRGVDHDETLLSVSATGQAEMRPDMASFTAGMSTIRPDAKSATTANAEAMNKLVAALEKQGIQEKDIQTKNVSVNRIDWGPNKNRFEAVNQVSVRVRKVETASAAIGAATDSGANILSGPSLTQSDPEKAKLSGYGAAYKAARAKADAYAIAAGMTVSRVLTIRDGGVQNMPMPYEYEAADSVAQTAAPVSAPPIRTGTDIETVSVTIDFALEPK